MDLNELGGALQGRLVMPRDEEYARCRRVWNGMIDRRPSMIVQCESAADVALAVRYTVANGMALTVRGGGHNVAGTAVDDDAVMVDLSPMRRVEVDADGHRARAGGGATLLDLDRATVRHDLACPVGVVSETGLGGLALGGGYGWLARKWGLTCDHVVGADVVLADGSLRHVSATEHPDLLWGLRGGGGNFGVVTGFELRLRPVGPATVRATTVAADAAGIRAYRDFAVTQPDDLQAVVTLHGDADEATMTVRTVWIGPPERDYPAVAELFDALGCPPPPATVMSHLELQTMLDGGEPWGRRYYTTSRNLSKLTDDTAESLAAAASACPSKLSTIDLGYLRGAVSARPAGDTAVPGRDADFVCSASAAWTEPAGDDENVAWSRSVIAALPPDDVIGGYVNYQERGTADEVLRLYGESHHARLLKLKEDYDPTNLFRANQNIAATRR